MSSALLRVRLLAPPGTGHHAQPGRRIAEFAPALVCRLRSMDADAGWHFRYISDPQASLELCFRSHPATIATVEASLRRHCAARGWQLCERDWDSSGAPWWPATGVSHAETKLAEALSVLSSDLALELLAIGALDTEEHVHVAALYLRLLIELMPPENRLAFLFQGWQHWGRSLTPSVRVDLGKQADEIAPAILQDTARLATASGLSSLWGWHARALHARWAEYVSKDETPRPYTLFEHAHLTHNRLAIPVEAEVTAAQALRSALSAAATGLPDLPAALRNEDPHMEAA